MQNILPERDFKNLRIRAYMQSAVISDRFLPLDGILFYHLIRRNLGEFVLSRPGESVMSEEVKAYLPLARKKPRIGTNAWFYLCSFAQWPENTVENSSFKVKQGDWLKFTGFLNEKVKRIDAQRGKFKAYHIKMWYRFANYIDWYCVGNPEEICKLLQFCTNIGKNGGEGWGQVKNWEVTEWPEDWSIRGFGGKLMRNVPLAKQTDRGILYGLRPSYWEPKNQFYCKMPDLDEKELLT